MTLRAHCLLLLVVVPLLAGCSVAPGPALPSPETEILNPLAVSTLSGPTPARMSHTVAPPTTRQAAEPTLAPAATLSPSDTPTPVPTPTVALPLGDLSAHLSLDSLTSYLEDLTAIQAYSGWRDSATEGETEALDYVAGQLDGFDFLGRLGLEQERQSFRVFCATELWETRLDLTVDGEEIEVPADGLRGSRDDDTLARRFDSDGKLGDRNRNPVVVEGPVLMVGSEGDLQALSPAAVREHVLLVDYALIDRIALGSPAQAAWLAGELLALKPAALVFLTSASNRPGDSHGSFVASSNPLSWLPVSEQAPSVPTLYARLEDMHPAGIAGWQDLWQVQAARVTWDADVLAPGSSGNLVARIPGTDPSRAVILGAHIDSAAGPGAMDDGSGSAILLEVARVLDAAEVQPPVDLYLAWFGSEEIGAYGSAHFAATHQELLDRTLAMLQVDCLTHPLDGMEADLTLTTWPYGRLGDDRSPWLDYLGQVAEAQGVTTVRSDLYSVTSDNAVMVGFGVPNANMLYESPEMADFGPIHYAAHIHDPYDTVELAREMGDVFEQMAQVALAAALQVGQEAPVLRVAPPPAWRAVFVGSHTENLLMAPMGLLEFGQALAMEGFDVDLVPYGQPVAGADLAGADLVVVLPVQDYPVQGTTRYDEAWSEPEIAALESYVGAGGLLVLTGGAHSLAFNNQAARYNEDWRDVNDLAERFRISYRFGELAYRLEFVQKDSHPLMEGVSYVQLVPKNGTPFTFDEAVNGQALSEEDGKLVVGLVDYGEHGGQVLALADLGILGNDQGPARNLVFWQNLARYARTH